MKLPSSVNGPVVITIAVLLLIAVLAYFGYEHWSTLQQD